MYNDYLCSSEFFAFCTRKKKREIKEMNQSPSTGMVPGSKNEIILNSEAMKIKY